MAPDRNPQPKNITGFDGQRTTGRGSSVYFRGDLIPTTIAGRE